jgi:hypothetical protein
MRWERVKRFFQLPGPVLSLTLIGILLLSAVLYYRAVKIQRFLEPALAISTPRFLFSKNMNLQLSKEFGVEHGTTIKYMTNSIFIDKSLLPSGPNGPGSDPDALKKLGQVFLSVLQDPNMSDYVDFILIGIRFPAAPDAGRNEAKRRETQRRAEFVLHSLFRVTPELEKDYGKHFSATALPDTAEKNTAWVEFRFIPSEMLHIEVLKSLKKYVH